MHAGQQVFFIRYSWPLPALMNLACWPPVWPVGCMGILTFHISSPAAGRKFCNYIFNVLNMNRVELIGESLFNFIFHCHIWEYFYFSPLIGCMI